MATKPEIKLSRDEQVFFDIVSAAVKTIKPDRFDMLVTTAREAAIRQLAGNDFNQTMLLYDVNPRRYSQMLSRVAELSRQEYGQFYLLPPDIRKLSCRAAKALQDYSQEILGLIDTDVAEWECFTRLDLHIVLLAAVTYGETHDTRVYPLSAKVLLKSLLEPDDIVSMAYGEFYNAWPLQARVVAGLAENAAVAIPGKGWQLEDYWADLTGVELLPSETKTKRVRF